MHRPGRLTFGGNSHADALQIGEDVGIQEAKNFIALRSQPIVALGISVGLGGQSMMLAIHLDHDTSRVVAEVDNVGTDWSLLTELATGAIELAQPAP